MRKLVFIPVITLMLMSCTQQKPTFNYPETAKVDTVDNYHGTDIPDPYRWLEDDMSEQTAAWVKAQNEVTFGYLETIPFRDAIKERMTELWNYPKMGTPSKHGDFYIYSYNTGLQNQSVIYKTPDLAEKGEVFIDPNTFSEDGTTSLAGLSFSENKKYAAYGISRGGSDWREFFVMDVESGKVLDDHLKWVKFSGMSWLGDGFFYSRYPEPGEGDELKAANLNAMVYYHKAGTSQEDDILIHKDPENPQRGFSIGVTEDEEFVLIYASESTSGNAFGWKKADARAGGFSWLVEDFEKDYSPIGNIGDVLYVLTNDQAPNYRLVAIDTKKPGRENWKEIIPETDNVLEWATMAGGSLVASYIADAQNRCYVYKPDGSLKHEVALPGIGSIGGFSAKMDQGIAYYSFSSFNYPNTIFTYDIEANSSEVLYRAEVDFDAESYEVKQEFYESKDGTKVPMFIVHKKGLELDGSNPTMLYGYGGFNISMTPSYSTTRAVWLEQGGIFALANIRGGGEYGKEWHKAGTVLQKQNVFDDFIAASEYLIEKKYTSPERLACYGGSNGGLLIGAVVNQRPELFAAASPMVGVMDMLRFHKFTIGRYWTVDYGSSEDPEQFEYLLGYSPLHNISSDKGYPAILVTTGDHDDRVVPAHSFKYAATLQEHYKGENPVMIRINVDAGHGAGKPTDMIIQEYADVWAFFFDNMDLTPEY